MNQFVKLDVAGNRLSQDAADWAIVLDESTGLMWPKDDSGERLDDVGEAKYIAHLNETAFGGHRNWTMPSRLQLLTIVDLDKFEPAASTEYFPGTKSAWYRTSTPCAWSDKDADGRASLVWFVNFNHGGVSGYHRDDYAFARAVRVAAAPARQ